MRRMVIILLLLTFAYMQGGYFIHSLSLRRSARREFKEALFSALPDTTFDKFSLADITSSIIWEEEGKEFWLNNQLYDVVKTKQEQGKTYLYCINDAKEEKIIEQQTELTRNNAQGSRRRAKSIKYHLPDINFSNEGDAIFNNRSSQVYYSSTRGKEAVQHYDPVSPPPQV